MSGRWQRRLRLQLLAGTLGILLLMLGVQLLVLIRQPERLQGTLLRVLLVFTAASMISAALVCWRGDYLQQNGTMDKSMISICLIAVIGVSQLTIGVLTLCDEVLTYDRQSLAVAAKLFEQIKPSLREGFTLPELDSELVEEVRLFPDEAAVQQNVHGKHYAFPVKYGVCTVIFSSRYLSRKMVSLALGTASSVAGLSILSLELFLYWVSLLERRPGTKPPMRAAGEVRAQDMRFLAFLFLLSAKLGSSFLPAWARQLAQQTAQPALWAAMPQCVELLATCAGIFVCARLTRVAGWKTGFSVGVLAACAGTVATGLSSCLALFLLSRLVFGLGYGLVWMTLRTLTLQGEMQSVRDEAMTQLNAGIFAGMNLGIALGSLLADVWDIRFVLFAGGLLGLLCLGTSAALRDSEAVRAVPRERVRVSRASALSLGAFVLVMIFPTGIASAYLWYDLPIRLPQTGRSITDVGALQLCYGIVISYVGPALVKRVSGRRPSGALCVLYAVGLGVALLAAGLSDTLTVHLLAVVAFGLLDSVGALAQSDAFLRHEAVRVLGDVNAMSLLSFFKKLSESTGTLVFSLAGAVPVSGLLLACGLGKQSFHRDTRLCAPSCAQDERIARLSSSTNAIGRQPNENDATVK